MQGQNTAGDSSLGMQLSCKFGEILGVKAEYAASLSAFRNIRSTFVSTEVVVH